MIDASVEEYLQSSHSVLNALGNNQITCKTIPTDWSLPWVQIRMTGGNRERLSHVYVSPHPVVEIEADSDDFFQARMTLDAIINLMDFFRGDLAYDSDVYIRCTEPFYIDSPEGVERFLTRLMVSSLQVITAS